MTASHGNTSNPPFATGIDAFVYPIFIGDAQRAPSTQDIQNPGTRWQDNSVSPPNLYETTGAGLWYIIAPSSGGSGILSLSNGTTDVLPDGSGNIAILGNGQVVATSNPGSHNLQLSLSGELSLGDVTINGSLNAEGNVEIHGQLTVDGATILDSNLTASGIISLSGPMTLNSGGNPLTIEGFEININEVSTGDVNIGTSGSQITLGQNSGNGILVHDFTKFQAGISAGNTFIDNTNTPYTATSIDTFFNCAPSVALTINLANNVPGTIVVVCDTDGLAGTNNITVNAPMGYNIYFSGAVASPSATISTNFGSLTMIVASSSYYVIAQG